MNKNLTELEKKFLEVFVQDAQELDDDLYEDITKYLIEYACDEMKMTKSQIKGVIGSLVNKEILRMDEVNGDNALIYDAKEVTL